MVCLILTSKPANAYTECIINAANYYNVNPYLLYAIAKVESGLNPYAINQNRNGSKDHGMFQINSSNLKRLGIPTQYAYDPCYSAYLGAYFLKSCINTYGNTWTAIDCYNKGYKATGKSRYVWLVYRELKRIGAVN